MSENILIPLNYLDIECSQTIELANAEIKLSTELSDIYNNTIKLQYPAYPIPKFGRAIVSLNRNSET